MTIRLRSSTHKRVVALILMALFLQSCALRNNGLPHDPDRDIAQVAKVLEVTANAVVIYQRTIINANSTTPKLISDPTADQLVGLSRDMLNSVQAASEATRKILKLTPAERQNVANLLGPIAKALDDALKSPGLASITNEQTRLILQTSLTSIQSTVASVQLMLAVR